MVSIKDIFPGERLNKNIWVKRPGLGDFLAKDYKKLIGKKVKIKINKNILSKKLIYNNMKKNILFVTGTRADFEKLKSIIKLVKSNKKFNTFIAITGMHLLKEYGSTYTEVEKF